MISQLLWGYDAVALFGAGTVVLAIGVSVPQFVHIRRGNSVAGVSLSAVTNSAISFLAWTVYALSIGDGWLFASSIIGLPFAIATAVTAWRYGAGRTGIWVTGTWSGILLLTVYAEADGRDVARFVVGASIGWLVVPAVVTAWRSHDVDGISAGSWWVLAGEGLLFLGYGIAQTVGAPIVYGVVALTGSCAVLGRLALGNLPLAPVRHAVLTGPAISTAVRPATGGSARI